MTDDRGNGRPWREVWAKRVLIGICSVIGLIGAGFLGAAFLPRWWSHRIGDQVNGSIGGGVALGLFYGFVFTAIPLAVLYFAFSKRRSLKTWAIMFGVAIVIAIPNLLTLGVVLGSGNASHAGERTLDVEAPAFRSSSLAGAVLALLAFGLLVYLVRARRHAHRELDRLRQQVKELKQGTPPPAGSAPPGGS